MNTWIGLSPPTLIDTLEPAHFSQKGDCSKIIFFGSVEDRFPEGDVFGTPDLSPVISRQQAVACGDHVGDSFFVLTAF